MDPILQVSHLKVAFYTYYGIVRAVNDLSFTVYPNETVGLVGESGSGKTVAVLSIMGLIESPCYITGGEMKFRGRDLMAFSEDEWNEVRGSALTMCFQNPMQALNPVLRIGEQISRVCCAHRKVTKEEAWTRSVELLKSVYIADAEQVMNRYPHQLSGGMCQRVMLVIALICGPSLMILDEPTTGLDVTVQNQLLALIRQLRQEKSVSQLLITHDLAVVAQTCTRALVMYGGRVMEETDVATLFREPKHPYTKALLESVPTVNSDRVLKSIPGNVPEALELPEGCPFHPRCKYYELICSERSPDLSVVGIGHRVACHLFGEKVHV